MYKKISHYNLSDSLITMKLSRSSGIIDWNNTYSYSISRVYDYIHSIHGLPPTNSKDYKVDIALGFNNIFIPIESDANGVYQFIDPLPVSLLPFVQMSVKINIQLNNSTEINSYPYTNVTGKFSKSKTTLDKNSKIKIQLKSFDKLLNATINGGTIDFTP